MDSAMKEHTAMGASVRPGVLFKEVRTLKAVGYAKERVANELAARGLDALVLTSPENIAYATGYPAYAHARNPILFSLRSVYQPGVVIDARGDRRLAAWGFSTLDVDLDAEQVATFDRPEEVVPRILQLASGFRKLAVEPNCPVILADALRELPGVDVSTEAEEILLALRRCKTDAERELLGRAVEIAEEAVERVYSNLEVGSSRLEMIQLAKQSVIELGGDGVSHVTMSFGGANPEIGLDEVLEPGALVVVDVGAKLSGYTSDCRRYGFAGSVPEEVLASHAVTCEAVDRVASLMTPGASFGSLMAAGKEVFAQRGIDFLDSHVGHGIGMETEEEWIDDGPSAGKQIEEGMVVAIEMYAFAGSYGVIGNEETYEITAQGPRRLTKLDPLVRQIPGGES
jgi:Xaa-Pro aminopeptidase